MKLTSKIKGASKKQKMIIAALLVVAIGGTGTAVYASNQSQQKLNEAQAVVDKQSSALQNLEKEIQALFDEKDTAFLAEDVTINQIDELKAAVSAVEKNYAGIDIDVKKLDTKAFSKEKATAEEQLTAASEKLLLQEAVNALFSSKDKVAIKGSTVNEELAIADKMDETAVQSVKETINESRESTFDQAALTLVEAAEGQLKQITTAKTATEKVYKDKVISTDQKLYDAAKKEVDKVKNATAKKALSDQLDKVKKDIDKKAEEAKKAEEKKKQEESGQDTQANTAAEATGQEQQVTADGQQQAATDQNGVATDQGAAGNNYNNDYNYGSGNQSNGTGAAGTGTGSGSGTGQTPSQPSNPNPGTGGGSGSGTTPPPVVIEQPNPGNCGRWFDSEGECVAAKNAALLADDNAVSASHWWDLQSDGTVKWTYSLNY